MNRIRGEGGRFHSGYGYNLHILTITIRFNSYNYNLRFRSNKHDGLDGENGSDSHDYHHNEPPQLAQPKQEIPIAPMVFCLTIFRPLLLKLVVMKHLFFLNQSCSKSNTFFTIHFPFILFYTWCSFSRLTRASPNSNEYEI